MKIVLKEDFANQLLNYLGQQPYAQVRPFIEGMLAAEQLPDAEANGSDPEVVKAETEG